MTDTKLNYMIRRLAEIEVVTYGFPESWHELMICTHIESIVRELTKEEIEKYFMAVFGEEELEERYVNTRNRRNSY